MNQAEIQPHKSLYFNYQVYPAARRPVTDEVAKVVVIGAGPVGLTTALLLAKFGVPCELIEAERQVCEGSRAVVFTRRSLEILQQLGADKTVLDKALPWRFGNSYYRGQQVFRMEGPHNDDERFFPMNNLQQQFIEQILIDLVQQQPLIQLRWGQKVVKVPEIGSGQARAAIEIEAVNGSYVQRAEYVVACDGARSSVRSLLDLKLEGSSYEGRFVIADIRIKLPLPTERLAFFDPPWNPRNTVLMHREPFDIWRVDYQLPAGESAQDALQPESLTTRINAQLQMIGHGGLPWELDWSSVYSARALTLPSYQHGRFLFAGDAAHLLPIFGVRGANTGFQDAQNLAWKLAAVVKGQSAPGLLDSYSHERVAAAREIVQEAGKSTRFMTPPTRGFMLLRDAVLSLSLTETFVRPLYHWRTSRPHVYSDSQLNSTNDDNALFAQGPSSGEPMANVKLGEQKFLMDDFPAGYLLLMIGVAGAKPAEPSAEPSAKFEAVIQRVRAQGIPVELQHNHHPRVVEKYGTGVYLFRPDQHVCARWLSPSAAQLAAALQAATQVILQVNIQGTTT
jgi:3-(3-hydroxy-phenyl)propionate hydroxylase